MKINSNIQAQITNSVLKSNESKYSKSTEKLSSGYKLNRASDSPAGMAISNKMHAQIRSLNRAKDNAKNAVNAVQTSDGALNEVQEMLQRMNQLAVKAANGTMSGTDTKSEEDELQGKKTDREIIQEEIEELKKEINRVAADTEYNTQNLLGGAQEMKGYNVTDGSTIKVMNYDPDFPSGIYQLTVNGETAELKIKDDSTTPATYKDVQDLKSLLVDQEFDDDGNLIGGKVRATLGNGCDILFSYKGADDGSTAEIDVTGIGGMKIQVGTSSGKEIRVVIPKMDTENMGIDKLDVRTADKATKAIDQVGYAIDYVSRARSKLGAYQNRLESTVDSLDENIENLTESYSTIKDVDMAEEMVNYTTLQVLVQAGTSMLTQANEQPQQALQLLQ